MKKYYSPTDGNRTQIFSNSMAHTSFFQSTYDLVCKNSASESGQKTAMSVATLSMSRSLVFRAWTRPAQVFTTSLAHLSLLFVNKERNWMHALKSKAKSVLDRYLLVFNADASMSVTAGGTETYVYCIIPTEQTHKAFSTEQKLLHVAVFLHLLLSSHGVPFKCMPAPIKQRPKSRRASRALSNHCNQLYQNYSS